MKQCSKCNTTNGDNAQFCCNCGESLAPPKPKFCIQCGTAIEEGHSFCPNCGTPIGVTQPNSIPVVGKTPTPKINGIKDAIRVCLKEKYASFEGRATRAEYWYYVLFYTLIMIPIYALLIGGNIVIDEAEYYSSYYNCYRTHDEALAIGIIMIIVACISILAFLLPGIAATVRRLHDTGKSGWWYFINFVPYVGGIVLLIFTILESEPKDNEYGPYLN